MTVTGILFNTNASCCLLGTNTDCLLGTITGCLLGTSCFAVHTQRVPIHNKTAVLFKSVGNGQLKISTDTEHDDIIIIEHDIIITVIMMMMIIIIIAVIITIIIMGGAVPEFADQILDDGGRGGGRSYRMIRL